MGTAAPNTVTPAELARTFRVTRETVLRWAKAGVIPSFRVGNVIRFEADEVRTALRRRNAGFTNPELRNSIERGPCS